MISTINKTSWDVKFVNEIHFAIPIVGKGILLESSRLALLALDLFDFSVTGRHNNKRQEEG